MPQDQARYTPWRSVFWVLFTLCERRSSDNLLLISLHYKHWIADEPMWSTAY